MASALLLLAGAWLIFRGLIRQQYLRRGRLTWWATLLQVMVLCGWVCFSAFQYPDTWPHNDTPAVLKAVGWTVFVGGLGATLWAGARLGGGPSFGVTKAALQVSGPYALVRHPQLAAFGLALIGHTILWPTWRLTVALLLYFPIAHLMAITEEEHLTRTLGDAYRAYRTRVPRYVPIRRRARDERP